MKSYYAVKIYGSGHVVAYNRSRTSTTASTTRPTACPTADPNTPRDRLPVSIDIYNNDISNVDDNCIEADGGMHNIRILRNRCFNPGLGALSPQPMFGGPVYFIRNVVYNSVGRAGEDSGRSRRASSSITTPRRRVPADLAGVERALPQQPDPRAANARPALFAIDTHTTYELVDYNGFRLNDGAEFSFQWNSPPLGGAADFTAPREVRRFKTLEEYQAPRDRIATAAPSTTPCS